MLQKPGFKKIMITAALALSAIPQSGFASFSADSQIQHHPAYPSHVYPRMMRDKRIPTPKHVVIKPTMEKCYVIMDEGNIPVGFEKNYPTGKPGQRGFLAWVSEIRPYIDKIGGLPVLWANTGSLHCEHRMVPKPMPPITHYGDNRNRVGTKMYAIDIPKENVTSCICHLVPPVIPPHFGGGTVPDVGHKNKKNDNRPGVGQPANTFMGTDTYKNKDGVGMYSSSVKL